MWGCQMRTYAPEPVSIFGSNTVQILSTVGDAVSRGNVIFSNPEVNVEAGDRN